MRVAIAYENGYVAQHFGRCPAFLFVNRTFFFARIEALEEE